uniref:Organ-specific protein P4-like isoform X2 n=2 Tax=Rhizophora mucronata TaxID=61149 RepID=A0A2P2IPK6_RHIMU
MKFSATLLSLSLFLLLSISISARRDAGEYWRGVMKDQPMPEAIRGLVRHVPIISDSKTSSHTDAEENAEHKGMSHFVKDFGPGLGANVHINDVTPSKDGSFIKDFKPRPNVSAYGDDKEEKSFVTDFDPRPNVFVYDNEAGPKDWEVI